MPARRSHGHAGTGRDVAEPNSLGVVRDVMVKTLLSLSMKRFRYRRV